MEELSLETSVVAAERSVVSFVVTSFSWERSRTRATFLPERLFGDAEGCEEETAGAEGEATAAGGLGIG